MARSNGAGVSRFAETDLLPVSFEMAEEDAVDREDSQVTREALMELLVRQEYRCALTGDELTPENCSADHIISVASGGSSGMSNVQLVTEQVNQSKGVMSQAEFVSLCRRVVARQS